MEQNIFYPEATRGRTDIGWLNARHAFNFARFHDSQRDPFGALVILNEDTIEPGKGFGTHGHSNMEIISVILEGKVRHVDSMGNVGYIDRGEAQVISAGTGITHSEYNDSNEHILKLLQIWIMPETIDVTPKYGQMTFDDGEDGLKQIASPDGKSGALRLHQQAWVSFARMQSGQGVEYSKERVANGVYVYVITGGINILGQELSAGDAMGITGTSRFHIDPRDNASVVIIDVPMS